MSLETVDQLALANLLPSSITPLIYGSLLKVSADKSPDAPWRFAGIASDESPDVEDDSILKKCLDVTYANSRGYANWNHLEDPANQLGFLTKAVIIDGDKLQELQAKLGVPVRQTASVYIEGELYKHVPRAAEVFNIMKSIPTGMEGALGLSLDGSIARNAETGEPLKAFMRGVAITPKPAHPNTVVRLSKTLDHYNGLLLKNADQSIGKKLAFDDACLYVLRARPNWTMTAAEKLVKLAFAQANALKVS